ncbi:MAG: DUF2382 domain-containing protein [Rhizonema sp. NSF051]|nr:DUF2382 domain-containing protein [Rhizonema sp. NSF051]
MKYNYRKSFKVNVRKEVERDTAEVKDTVRREELDVDAPDILVDNTTNQQPKDRI